MFSARQFRRSRPLKFESLESRLALAGLVVDATTLADYLAQPVPMGPAAPAEVSAPSSAPDLSPVLSQTADALAEQLAGSSPQPATNEAEGEDPIAIDPHGPVGSPPLLSSFTVEAVDGGWVRLFGTIDDDNPENALVYFTGLFLNEYTSCDASGNFSLFVLDPGFSGFVTAHAVDRDYNLSLNSLTRYLE
jgi:hypothetical protein